MACKYVTTLEECKVMTSKQIIDKHKLSEKEIEIMKYLYKQQYPKEYILENLYCSWNYMPKKDISKILGSLKKKGLIYSVIGLYGWLGTEIRI